MLDASAALRLADEPDSAARARRLVRRSLADWAMSELADDAQLAVSELVTNAILHAGPPLEVRVLRLDDGVRIEVQDRSRHAPLRPMPSGDTMTGRGIGLVDAVAHRWGVDPLPEGTDAEGGKVVWCELLARPQSAEGAFDVDALLAAWDDGPDPEPTYTVELGDVPTDLLIEAKAHVDNLVRELTLAAAGEASGHGAAVPTELAALIDTVVHRFAEARQALKRQAIAAAKRGEARTHLQVTLSLSAVEPGEEYLAALDLADSYARDARLLTLETPPQHRAFRHWYVGALIQQVRRAAAGVHGPPPETFEDRLLKELGAVAAAQRATARAARLQSVTALLASAVTAEDVADVVVSAGVAALGAFGGSLMLTRGSDGLHVPGAVGYASSLVQALRDESPDADLPAASVMRSGEPVWLESRQARDEQFPGLAGFEPQTQSLCAVPLQVGRRVLGALRFSFDAPRLFDADERAFITALAAQTAQALERGELYDAERAARGAAEDVAHRLARLQEVTAALGGARNEAEVVDIVLTHAREAVAAELATVSLLADEDTLVMVGSRGLHEDSVVRWQTFRVDAQLPASEAVRTNAAVVVPTREEVERRYPALVGTLTDQHSLVCVPVSLRAQRLGAISLSFPGPHAVDDTELRFLRVLADTCAQALDRARALERSRLATEKLAFLAQASSELGSSLDLQGTLRRLAQLVVPRMADWAAVDILEDGKLRTLAVSHVDPGKVQFALDLRERFPSRPDATSGAPHVVRTGVSELVPLVTEEQLAAAAIDDEHLELLRSLGLRSGLTVPLTGRAGTFGALTLVAAESGRLYDESDLAFAEDLAARAAVAVENAQTYSQQSGRLAAITRVAEAAQHAILAPLPQQLGPVRLAAAYVSAAKEALVGGDLYEALEYEGMIRLMIGDVRGKGLDAVRMATIVLGHFRSAAVECHDVAAIARQVDARLRPYLGAEDFVTALLAEITPAGRCTIVSCGHPPAMVAESGQLRPVGVTGSLPLGLGADPEAVSTQLAPGARLLLYTDGLIEARNDRGAFVDLAAVLTPLTDELELEGVLPDILARLQAAIGGPLGDDLALLVAELVP